MIVAVAQVHCRDATVTLTVSEQKIKEQEKLDPNALDCFFCFFVYLVSPIIVLKLQV